MAIRRIAVSQEEFFTHVASQLSTFAILDLRYFVLGVYVSFLSSECSSSSNVSAGTIFPVPATWIAVIC
jgi:hypothetical protein